MAEFITFKRWKLQDGQDESELLALVRNEIEPHYQQLLGCLGIGLLHILGTHSYLALQYWESRDAWQAAISADDYPAWLEAYQPALERWGQLMVFEDEWETEDLLGGSDA
jgi:hypothetical protein